MFKDFFNNAESLKKSLNIYLRAIQHSVLNINLDEIWN